MLYSCLDTLPSLYYSPVTVVPSTCIIPLRPSIRMWWWNDDFFPVQLHAATRPRH